MPTIRPLNRRLADFDSATGALVSGGASESRILLTGEHLQYLSDLLPLTGNRHRSSLLEIAELLLNLGSPKPLTMDLEGYDVSVVVQTKGLTAAPNDRLRRILVDAMACTPSSPPQETTSELSPLVRSQVEQIVDGVDGVSVKLQERLSRFEANREDLEPVSSTTKTAVNDLVRWLCGQSDTVSATVSNDGTLSIAAGFQNDVRLYIEVERNGTTEAAVTRERRFARDIFGNTVADLTLEVLLDAIGSV